ncbi:retinoic acid-induced protein 1-like [Anguilla anguilla]|uniref:retinoic acid-induced protein 1-like n=1 Tax=Anguilla anguilla TaxID=7936 RepID=UPI0015A77035|nr:retinoic acid-induced protein 1-like [Anguilla anguilla]XP_035254450.1 retinoic acid-induced protein 1-like [Anguilla anguilla]XP_035254451.1 retinoic acid-induced protein 1-like [Anguilla anguilla]
MDRLSQGQSKDDALPQSPSTCSLPTAFDLSRRRRHGPGSPAPVGGLPLARAPRWRDPSSRGVEPPGSSSPSYRHSLTAQQVQPDNAFSNTTVTLSYINRSHLHSAQDQIAPGVRSVLPRAGVLSQHPPPDSKGHRPVSSAGRDGGGYRGQAANRQAGELAPRSEHLRAFSEAPPVEREKGGPGGVARFSQHAPGFNGKHELLAPGGAPGLQRRHGDSVAEGGNRFSQHREGDQRRGVPNGVKGGFWDLESCLGKYSSFRPRVEQRQGAGEASDRARRASRKLYTSLNEDFMSPSDERFFPAESSGDEMEDLGALPQARNSPSSDSPGPEEDAADVAGVRAAEGEGCRFTVQFVEVSSSPEDSSSDDSDVIEVPVTNSAASPPAGLPQPPGKPPAPPERLSERKRPTRAAAKTERAAPEERLNGITLGDGREVGRSKQPPHAILAALRREVVVNLTPLGPKAFGHARPAEQRAQPENLSGERRAVLPGGASDGDSACDSEAEMEAAHLAAAGLQDGGGRDPRPGRQKGRRSTSGSEDGSFAKSRDCSTSSPGPSTPNGMGMETETEAGQPGGPLPQSCPQKAVAKAPKRTRKQQKSRAKRSKTSSKPKKKRKRAGQPSSAFCPQEPEIKLKYATYREEKRDVRAAAFAPYVHLEKKEFSRCTVVNYLEEETGGPKKGRVRPAGPGLLAPGAVPATSCLELGRLDAEGRRRADQTCCLCGGSANAVDLGDLHGPYRPRKGRGPGPGAPAQPQGPKDEEEEACSDSDTSSYDGRRGERGGVQVEEEEEDGGAGAQPRRPSPGPRRDAALAAQCRWFCDEDSLQDPAAQTPCPAPDRGDQRSAPAEALHSGEFWLHEDCGVWSTGVFLVRGRLYGLEEAVRLAQGTVCSTCHAAGATLGCFFKGCPNKYHYRCALLSDCVLNEENFTMKCTKHKNKCLKGVSRTENR